MPKAASAAFEAVVERHHEDLPVYVLVPPEAVAAFGRDKTFIVETTVNDREIGRRSVKRWGDGRWFLEFTKQHCKRLSIAEGDRVRLVLAEAPDTPADLAVRIEAEGLDGPWRQLSEAQRRAIAEPIFDAKRDTTRRARINKALSILREPR